MLVSHRKKFIFTKTLKTAGTSVESYFEQYCMPEGAWEETHAREAYVSETGIIGFRGRRAADKTWTNHMPARKIRDQVGQEVWDRYYKFTTVRNPYDKLISYFTARLAKKESYARSKKFKASASRILGLGNPIHRMKGDSHIELFQSWLKLGGEVIDSDKYKIEDQVCVDFFIRFEHLHEDIRHVCRQLQIPYDSARLPEFKKGGRKRTALRDYYDEECVEIVKSKYAWELKAFNYSLDDGLV